jgi:argininosuccinate lyase
MKKSSRNVSRVDEQARDYAASIPFDRRLYRQDIEGSIAHARMLAKQGIVAGSDAAAIIRGLDSIRKEIERGKFRFKTELEDIHMNIEARLFEKIGEVAGKLHTARSRNDQMALDLRLFVKEETGKTIGKIRALQISLVELAAANKDVIMPGYTHLQQAQPVLLAHHLLAYFEMFQRDKEREFLARRLGFGKVSSNSLDAVSDRDFIVEYEAAAAIAMMHLSRLAEELILWSSSEFDFIEIGEAFTTGSSIMPQKKNPDVAELARGKTGRVYGHLVGILTVMKSLPLAYNRDMQEDKEALFDTVDTLQASLEAFAGMVKTVDVNTDRIAQAMRADYILATDLADYLVKKGMPFRKAHGVIAKLSEYALDKSKNFRELRRKEYREFSPLFTGDVYDITPESSVAARNVVGGTSPQQVAKALRRARRLIKR